MRPSSSVMPPASGTSLGPYQIDAPLGAGGMGEVYRARDTKLDRDGTHIPPHSSTRRYFRMT